MVTSAIAHIQKYKYKYRQYFFLTHSKFWGIYNLINLTKCCHQNFNTYTLAFTVREVSIDATLGNGEIFDKTMRIAHIKLSDGSPN